MSASALFVGEAFTAHEADMMPSAYELSMIGAGADFDADNLGFLPTNQPYSAGGGHSTRDAVLGIAGQGMNLLGTFIGAKYGQPNVYTTGGAPMYPQMQPAALQPVALQNPNAGANVAANVAGNVGGVFDSIAASLGVSTSTLMLMGGGALFLLFMRPPGRR